MHRLVPVLLLLLLALLPPGVARAARGVAVDVGRIDIRQNLTPGGSYRLPTIGVRNPGDERTSYVMVASPVEDPRRDAPPIAWFRFSPSELTLDPGETEPVQARIELPRDAEPGEYIALVGAQIASEGEGALVGAAAAARLTFTVEPATALEALWLQLKTFFEEHTPWTWLVPSLVGLGLLGAFVRRRFSFSVERRTT